MAEDRLRKIEEICIRLLARREHSQKELFDKLLLRGFQYEDCKPVIMELAGRGWQSDQRFSESFVRQRILKGYGPYRITQELKQRGVTMSGIELESLVEEIEGCWLNVIERVYLNRYSDDITVTSSEWLKRNRFLLQRGFSADLIKALFSHFGMKLDYQYPRKF